MEIMGCERWRLIKALLGWKVLPRHPHTDGTKFLQKKHPWQREQREFFYLHVVGLWPEESRLKF